MSIDPLPEASPSRTAHPVMARPIMALLDLVSRRWALRILWELRDGPLTSRALRSRCDDVSPTVLQTRVTELRQAGLVDLAHRSGYRLSTLGMELGAVLLRLSQFADIWSQRSAPPSSP